MKRIAISIIVALGIHGLLLSANFDLPGSSVEPVVVSERLTVVMLPVVVEKKAAAPEPMPVRKSLPILSVPPVPTILAKVSVPQPRPKPKKSLKARTYKPRQPESLSAPVTPPVVQPMAASSVQSENSKPEMAATAVAKPPKRLTTVAAVHKTSQFLPDRLATPLLKKNPPPDYPNSARRRGYQGSVILKVLVGANGRVEKAQIDQTCGYAILDRTALTAVRGWQFDPGVKKGKKVKMWVKVPVRFELK